MNISLRSFTDGDTKTLAHWLTLPHVSKWYHHPEAWLYEIAHRHDEYDFIQHYIVVCDGKDIGFCQYYDYNKGGETFHGDTDIALTASIDYMIADTEYIGRHLAPDIIVLLEAEAAKAGFAKIIVQPEQDNAASRGALRAAGYISDTKNDIFIKVL